jgi:hypothetical protein
MRRVGLILLLLCIGVPLPAQWQLTADAGSTHLRQNGVPESNAFTLGANVDLLGERAALRSRALASCGNQVCTGQGILLASLLGPNPIGTNWELSGAVSGFGVTNEASTKSAEGMARLRLGSTFLGAAVGAGVGAVSDVFGTRALYHTQATVWRTFAVDQLIADASFVGTPAPDVLGAEPTRYADASAGWRRFGRVFEVGATAGVRAGIRGAGSGGWGSLDAAAWVAPNLALVATAGRSLEDIPRGVPRTQYVSVALRIAARSHASVLDARPSPSAPKTIVTRAGVSLQIDSASRVELMADFTDWVVVSLERDGKKWKLDRALPSGLHRIAIRVDGGEWFAPPGLPRATDDLGGEVGLITVP